MTSTSAVSVREFFDYLLRRDETHELALQLVYVHDLQEARRVGVGGGR